MRRRHGRRNPSTQTTTLLIAGGGLALLGVGVYLFTKKPAAATTTTAITATSPNSRPFGDPANTSSVAFACNTCWKLNALGHPTQATAWCTKCTANGGVVPQSAAQLYT